MALIKYIPSSRGFVLNSVRFSNSQITFNQDFWMRHLGKKKYLEIYYDEQRGQIGLGGSDDGGLTISVVKNGCQIRWQGAIKQFKLKFDKTLLRTFEKEEDGIFFFTIRSNCNSTST